ncbi:uncharacterized protein LOC118268079 [Spodoptera frugiperda]|uniref:Uncharacterized protein LOC118268079 n=1 Tax=Spodoptera frugiperda TaxID=7108 RepID=A0A9R0D2W2_SPOFR|nr:uncharacterized protein LOC118268079 [Spodoptera frugiperda]
MPFVQRAVEPKFLSRTSLRDNDGQPRVADEELQAVTNCTLSNALRQLASLVLLAEDIFSELTVQLQDITERSKVAQTKIIKINELVEQYDPKKVPVPEGSLSDFAARKVQYTASHPLKKGLFTPDTRPSSIRKLYEKATTDRLSASILDQLRRDSQHSPYLLCTPVLSTKRRRIYQKVDVEIETRIPSVVEQLRKWTSKEAMGDVTALPDASMRIASSVTLTPDELSECGSGDDEPIDHRLPSPDEQLRIIASKFPPEVVAIDTSGKFFDRMCSSRKSLHLESTTGETDTVKRRTRTRKPRGKRRNTISGTDQKELREAIAGDTSNAAASEEIEDSNTVIRSKSSDLLKKSPIDPVTKKGHFNSLKQWGKNRLKLIGRSPSASRDNFKDTSKCEKAKDSKSPPRQVELVQDSVTMRKKRPGDEDRRTHQRCASYSSSEKSIGVPSIVQPNIATINTGVKLRGTSVQRRLRRSATAKDEPHSSSGNWSASSESGRTSIGSEITTTTVPPKSTTSAATSNNSLNAHHGPPSSIISRRRFLNTSGSGSVTSEGTLTPDIIHDLHEDLETSSEFSCDTEGYYTSFHMDSGLKTLKEEEIAPSTPLHTSNALSNSSNSQNMTAENEYELFGKGSTSTTTSSAGTVCTTLMAAGSDRSLVIGPTVPERKSSLAKMSRNRTANAHSANTSLDRSINSTFSKSPFSSLRYNPVRYSDKPAYNNSSPEINEAIPPTITITRNVGNHTEITAVAEVHTETELESAKKSTGTSSPDSGHNTSSSPIEDSVSSAHGKNSLSEQDYSESSDLEGTERIERIRYKTTINSSRIPSMCVITPSNSDDESESSNKDSDIVVKSQTELSKVASRPKLDLPVEEKPKEVKTPTELTKPSNKGSQIKSSLQPFNSLMCKLKGVLPHKLSNKKSPVSKEPELPEDFYDTGDYVTIADVKNNNQKLSLNRGIYGNSDVVKKNLQTVLSGKLPETEYVSLNELPNCLSGSKDYLEHSLEDKPSPALDDVQIKGAKVTLDSQGQVIYSSDTLKRRKGAHTTFEPGPFVQEIKPTTTVIKREIADVVQVVDETDFPYEPPPPSSKPTSPQLGKMIIKAPTAPDGPMTTEFVTLPTPKPSTIITATPITETPVLSNQQHSKITKKPQDIPRVVEAITRTGAYVNIHDAEGVSLSPTKDDLADYRHSSADKPYLNIPPSVIQDKGPTVDLNAINPTLHRYHTAHLRGRHGVVDYDNSNAAQRDQPKFWTLPKRSNLESNAPQRSASNYGIKTAAVNLPAPEKRTQGSTNTNDESIKISPIDPRNSGHFKSSTPSNKENVVDLGTKLLSPVKSTMTNEELYAVIHKSKKKLNIKDTTERSESPALSTISLSPVNSETSLYTKGSQRHPETGYLGDPRNRMSWSPCEKQNILPSAGPIYGTQKQETNCADRYGPMSQTSRLDFKKLLLQHSVKLNTLPQNKTNKLSAVEQLKLSREKPQTLPSQVANRSQVNILDLSGSPKTYTHRKVMKPNVQPSSPGRTGSLIKEHKNTPKILLSPKSQWRFASPRSDVLSTPIPEAYNEDDNSNSSGEKHEVLVETPPSKTVPIVTNQHFGARRNLIPINETTLEIERNFPPSTDQGVYPLNTDFIRSQGLSRTEILQAKRAEFFNTCPESSPPKLTSFKSPNAAGPPVNSRSKTSPERGKVSPTTLETAL